MSTTHWWRAGFHAIHIPEEYGGEGGDQLAACIVAEEIARVCASSSLIPAVNKLGTTPLLVGASEELKQRYLSQVASGDAMFSYALSEREAGSDAASMKTRAVRDGDHYVLNGQKSWITNAGISKFYTVMASTDPDEGARGISAFVVHARRSRVLARYPGTQARRSTVPRPARSSSRTSGSRPTA